MNTRNLLNLVLLLAVVSIGLFLAYSPDPNEVTVVKLGGPAPDSINRMVIQREALADIHLQKTAEGDWEMTQPYTAMANPTPIQALLKLPETTSHAQFPAADRNLRDYDLLPAKASLHLDDQEYLFGNIEHINKRRYILKGDKVHLITDLFYHQLRINTESFISPKLVAAQADIAAFRLPGIELEKSAQGEWMISGDKAPGDDMSADAIQTLQDHWHNKQATLVSTAQPTDVATSISITLADNSELSFSVSQTDSEFIFARPDLGIQYHFPLESGKDLTSLDSGASH